MSIAIVFKPTSKRDQFGLIEFEATLTNNGKPVDRVILGSGARGAQELIDPRRDYPGSLRPIPEGVYRIGKVEHNPSGWGPGLGNYWVDLIPVKPANRRSAFGIHLDSNRVGSPGSAGCPVAATPDRLDRILKWIEATNRPGLFYVDYGKGYLKEIGMLPPVEPVAKPTAPAPIASRWAAALTAAKPKGCSDITASQDGLPRGGYQSSQTMARTDLQRVRSMLPALSEAAKSIDVPVAILAALASRESRAGNALDSGGWGDRGMAFGVLQVDRRYHQVVTSGGSRGVAHCKQAAGIFKTYLEAIDRKFPDWPDWAVLQGACVAYNSGVSNVATIERMDAGTTGNDYGNDVLARAQFYQNEV